MKKKLFLMGMAALLLSFGLVLTSCDGSACPEKSECNDGDSIACGDKTCKAHEYYTSGDRTYYYTCDCD